MENEKLDLQVGDRVTYKFIDEGRKDRIVTDIVSNNNPNNYSGIRWFKEQLEDKCIEILKIERPNYEIVEEKKELLTEEEREFLKQYIKMSAFNIKYIKKEFNTVINESTMITLNDGQGSGVYSYYKTNYFKNLEEDKKYTLEELGLEEE